MRIKFLITTIGVIVLLLSACSGTPDAPPTPTTAPDLSGRVTFAGSTTVQPLADKIGQAFNAQHPDVVLDIAAGGSSVGIQAVHDGTVDIGMASRALKGNEAEGITISQIAVDVIAVVVHADNPIDGLTLSQLHDIYLGTIANWSEVGGSDRDIVVVTRDINSGTRGAFDDLVLDGQEPDAPNLEKALTAGDMAVAVANNPAAIGYVGFGNFEPGIKPLAINSVQPSETAARNGSYILVRPLLLLTGPLTQPLAVEFVNFALSEHGQNVVIENGWVPAN
ncbi:MAG: phosphate ABC transporter substrate-binding protein [Anaerolineae bacterium]|nr:phosphate ABC transporter substrate-binding protein [Anaerolineae bacterium]